jgi:Lar family restriction alleviation protein
MTLKPCPFCGSSATIEQVGTPRMSCIVACDSCGARMECSDEGEQSGSSWNRRNDTVVRNLLEEGHEIISEYACGHTVWLENVQSFLNQPSVVQVSDSQV